MRPPQPAGLGVEARLKQSQAQLADQTNGQTKQWALTRHADRL